MLSGYQIFFLKHDVKLSGKTFLMGRGSLGPFRCLLEPFVNTHKPLYRTNSLQSSRLEPIKSQRLLQIAQVLQLSLSEKSLKISGAELRNEIMVTAWLSCPTEFPTTLFWIKCGNTSSSYTLKVKHFWMQK